MSEDNVEDKVEDKVEITEDQMEAIVDEVYEELYSPHKDIEAVYAALGAVDSIDGAMINRVHKINAIKQMSVDIIFAQIKVIHSLIESENK